MLELVFGALAALGAACLCRAVYDLLLRRTLCAKGRATLYLVVEGGEPCAEQLARTAAWLGNRYLPGMAVVLIDKAGENAPLRALCKRLGITYCG